jgi:hypothetical protein
MSAQTRCYVRVDVGVRPRGRVFAFAQTQVSAQTLGCVRADASVLSPGYFITDAIVRPSHGRPSGHCLIVRPSIRPSDRYRPRDHPGLN